MLTAEQARAELEYSPETGELRWKKRSRGRRIGDIAGSQTGEYRRIRILNETHSAHRLVWLLIHGKWPEGTIDHINRNGSDNRLCNLRDVTHAKNLANRGNFRNNTTGVKGVYRNRRGKPWKASIMHLGKFIHLGCFDTSLEAHSAYLDAYRYLHGEDANLPSG